MNGRSPGAQRRRRTIALVGLMGAGKSTVGRRLAAVLHMPFKDADTEIAFSEFRTTSGLTRPMRSVVSRGGKVVAELTVETFTALEKVDPKVFKTEE